MSNLRTVLLAEVAGLQEVEVLRVGTFSDMHGRQVAIDGAMLDALVAAFEQGVAQQDVPVDVDHQFGEAAGWVRRVWRSGEKLLAEIEWTPRGDELVGGKIYRYLSASIDVVRRVLRSVSLVNFPAVKGLQPLTLGEGLVGFKVQSQSEEDSMSDGTDVNALREQIRDELQAEFAQREQELAQLRADLREEIEAEVQQQHERRVAFVKFAEDVCGGDVALSAKPQTVVSFLEGIPPDLVETAMVLLSAKVTDFSERGSGAPGAAETGERQPLPEPYATLLAQGKLALADLKDPLLELGDLSQYDIPE